MVQNLLPIQADLIEHPCTYDPELFVDREREFQTIKIKINRARFHGIIDQPIVNFWGIKGIGKTWILQQIQETYSYRADSVDISEAFARSTFALLHTFSDDHATASLNYIAQSLAARALSQLSSSLGKEHEHLLLDGNTGNIDAVIQALLMLSHHFVPILLLDNVEKVDPSHWDIIEQRLIEPLAKSECTLIVVAGRRQTSRWRSFEIRRRVIGLEQRSVHSDREEN